MAASIALAATLCLSAFVLLAVASDLRQRRIRNKLVLLGIVAASGFHVLAMGQGVQPLAGAAWWSPLAGLAAGFGLLLPLYLLRATGAGDVKLMAMVGAFVGAQSVLTATLYTLLAGGLLSLLFMLGKGVAAETVANLRYLWSDWFLRVSLGQGARLAPLQHTAARLPYAVAIAVGTGSALLWPLVPK
jgi:prepilin peptidase CpaA